MSVDLFHLSADLFTAYLLVSTRVIGLLTTMPMFGERTVPWQTKVGTGMLIGWLLLPLANTGGGLPTGSMLELSFAVTREFMVGMLIGYLARLLFAAFQFAVNAIDFQIGLAFVQIVNPGADVSLSVIGQFLNTIMLLLFLEMDGHHLLLRALGKTLQVVPLGTADFTGGVILGIAQTFGLFVIFSLQIALPTVMVLLLIDLAMGIIGRVLPQLNVFLVALPIKLMVGMVTLALTMPAISQIMAELIDILVRDSLTLIRML